MKLNVFIVIKEIFVLCIALLFAACGSGNKFHEHDNELAKLSLDLPLPKLKGTGASGKNGRGWVV